MLLYKLYCHIQVFLFRKSLLARTAVTFRLDFKLDTVQKKSVQNRSKLALKVFSKCVCR